jgi:hypothetical protein
VSTFNDQGVQLLGLSADELNEIGANEGEDALKARLNAACWNTFVVKTRSKREFIKEENRLKSTVVQLWPMDWPAENAMLIDAIEKY